MFEDAQLQLQFFPRVIYIVFVLFSLYCIFLSVSPNPYGKKTSKITECCTISTRCEIVKYLPVNALCICCCSIRRALLDWVWFSVAIKAILTILAICCDLWVISISLKSICDMRSSDILSLSVIELLMTVSEQISYEHEFGHENDAVPCLYSTWCTEVTVNFFP